MITRVNFSPPNYSNNKVGFKSKDNEELVKQVMKGKIKSITWSDILDIVTDKKYEDDGELFDRLERQIVVKKKLSKITRHQDKKAIEDLKNRTNTSPVANAAIQGILRETNQ